MTKPSVFQLIDLDRTLFDTSKFAKALTDEVNEIQPGLGTELDRRFEEAYAKEETFFLLRYLREAGGNEWFEALVERIITKYGADVFMMPGMVERLAFADTLGGWGILTYGDAIDQEMKQRIIGLEKAPMCIVDTPDKSAVVASWKLPDGRFQLPEIFGGGIVDTITLEDDKRRAFMALPDGALGVWVTPQSLTELGNEFDANLLRAGDLLGSTELLKAKFL